MPYETHRFAILASVLAEPLEQSVRTSQIENSPRPGWLVAASTRGTQSIWTCRPESFRSPAAWRAVFAHLRQVAFPDTGSIELRNTLNPANTDHFFQCGVHRR